MPGTGWQHGAIPDAPEGLRPESVKAWETWMAAWFASHWMPADLPGLRKVILLYDQTERGEFHRSAELRMGMDGYGITPKGRQMLHWLPPKADETPVETPDSPTSSRYAKLRAV